MMFKKIIFNSGKSAFVIKLMKIHNKKDYTLNSRVSNVVSLTETL